MHFEGKIAIVTGGKGALGSVIARHFLDHGATVVIPYRKNAGRPPDVPSELRNERTHLIQADLANNADAEAFVAEVAAKFGILDFLVNAAGGYAGGKTIDGVSFAEWEKVMEMNLTTTFLACRNVLRVMLPHNSGRIVNIAAMPAVMPGKEKGPYTVSKRGVITLTEVIAEEVKGKGITANAIAPSILLTEENRLSMPTADMRKWVTTEEVAQLVMFLCSDEARSISGNVIKIFGGV